MRSELALLADRHFDLLVVGGGIFGIFSAWDAALRGLSVALVERGDFAAAASANCFKIVHGGVRYLQHLDLPRARQSSHERSTWLRIAPHQVRPLPIVVPTYGHGMRSRALLGAGLKAYDLLTWDRNRGVSDARQRVPATRVLSRAETLEAFPFLEVGDLTGGGLFHDGQMDSPGRLALCTLLGARTRGAVTANHVEATGLLRRNGRVEAVACRDTLSGAAFDVRARVVLNAAGGWAPALVARSLGCDFQPPPVFSRDACFVVRRSFSERFALALSGRTHDPDALLSRSARHIFLAPWHGRTLVGVWHRVQTGDPDRVVVSEADLAGFLDEINGAHPALELRRDEVALVHWGLVLFGENPAGAEHLRYGKRSLLLDHAPVHGVENLLTLIGVRYTTARAEAERTIDLVLQKLDRSGPRSRTAMTPIHGGAIGDWEEFRQRAQAERPASVDAEVLDGLLRRHGDAYRRVLAGLDADVRAGQRLGGIPVLRAEILHAVREEMACKLADVVFRRTDLGTRGHPGAEALEAAAEVMAAELGWTSARRDQELLEVQAAFPRDAAPSTASLKAEASGARAAAS